MAGYTGQLLALNAEPFNLASPLEAANTIRSGQLTNELNSQLAPLRIQQAQQENDRYGGETPLLLDSDKIKNQAAALALKGQGRADTLQDQAFQRQLIAQAAGLVDPNDPDAPAKWDEAMQAAADKGAAGAKQFVGRYNPALHQRVTQAYGAETPLAAHAAMTSGGMVAASPLATATGGTAAGLDPNMQAQLDQMPIEHLSPVADHLGKVKAALIAVRQSANPAQTWAQEAATLGLSEIAGPYQEDRANQLYGEIEPALRHIQGRLDREGSGLPAPLVPHRVENVGGRLYSIDPAGTAATPISPRAPDYQVAPGAIGADLKPFVLDKNTGQWVQQGNAGLSGFVSKIVDAESGGAADASNPRSTATGAAQFLDKTWIPLVKAARPDLAEGKTDAQILALRNDPQLSAEMTATYAQQNAPKLSGAGQPVNATTLAIAHRLGPADAVKVLTADPKAPLKDVLSPAVIAANPDLKDQTVGGFGAQMAARFGFDPVLGDAPAASGSDYLKALPPERASMLQAIADGRVAPPSGSSLRSPQMLATLAQLTRAFPGFDATTWTTRYKTAQDFANAKGSGGQLTSMETLNGHAQGLMESARAIGNFNGLMGILNGPKTYMQDTLMRDPAIRRFNLDRQAVVEELERTWRGTGGNASTIAQWEKNLNQADSPDQVAAAVSEIGKLVHTRAVQMQKQYAAGMTPAIAQRVQSAVDASAQLASSTPPSANGPPPVAQRVVGKTYQSPRGPVTWNGKGWDMANAATQ